MVVLQKYLPYQPRWHPVIAITVPGDPVGASRPIIGRGRPPSRATLEEESRADLIRRILNPRPARAFFPDSHKDWEALAVKTALATQKAHRMLVHDPAGKSPITGIVKVHIVGIRHRPQQLRRKKDYRGRLPAPIRPDLDNIAKLALDAMTKAGVWQDDNLVVRLEADDWYCAIGEHVRGGKAPDAEPPRTIIGIYAEHTGA